MIANFDDKILSAEMTSILDLIAKYALKFNLRVFFVGGFVRDLFLGIKNSDIDIVVEGNAIEFVENIKEAEIVSIHKDFGTIKAIIKGTEIDFASTREEDYPCSGCLPVVKNIGCNIKEDLKRRDYTINAIALEFFINAGALEFEIVDYFEGINDIKNKTLKILHDKSFVDDPTRILRGIDFELRFGFKFSVETKNAAKKYLLNPNRENISRDRTLAVLKKLFGNKKTAKEAFKIYIKNKVYRILFDDNEFNMPDFNAIEETLKTFKNTDICEFYFRLAQNFNIKKHAATGMFEIFSFFETFTDTDLALYYLKTKDENCLTYYNDLKNNKILTKGRDLIALGMKQGAGIGEILTELQKAKFIQKFASKEDEIAYLKNNIKGIEDGLA